MGRKHLIRCSICNFDNQVDFDEADDTDIEISDDEREMGGEATHTFSKQVECIGCGKRYTAILHESEYPLGSPSEAVSPPYFT